MQYAHLVVGQASVIRGGLNSGINLGPSMAIHIMEVSLIRKAAIERFRCGHVWKLS